MQEQHTRLNVAGESPVLSARHWPSPQFIHSPYGVSLHSNHENPLRTDGDKEARTPNPKGKVEKGTYLA